MRKFKDLEVWKIGFDVMIEVYMISKALPKEEKYGLRDQIRRASVSIPSNIAEGCSRSSDKDFKRFLEIAMGSAFELETQVMAVERLEFAKHDFGAFYQKLNTLQKKLNALITSIKNRISKK
ncbi:MAG: four helix bundle protein [Cytophagales bacterium]|nr:four helix bundle protein [Cytophagales bacterium]